MRVAVMLLGAVLLLAGCGVSPPPMSSPASPSAAGGELATYRDPGGAFTLQYASLLGALVDRDHADHWGRPMNAAYFDAKQGSGLEGSGVIVVAAEDAAGELTATEATRYWARDFRHALRFATSQGAEVTDRQRQNLGDSTIYSAMLDYQSPAYTARLYYRVDGTRCVTLTMRSDTARYADWQPLLDEMIASLELSQ
jgi:hypothetical protein